VGSKGRKNRAQQVRLDSVGWNPGSGRRALHALQAVHAMTDDRREAYEERAAILQFDAGMTREQAEKIAARQVLMTPDDLIEFEQGQSDGRA